MRHKLTIKWDRNRWTNESEKNEWDKNLQSNGTEIDEKNHSEINEWDKN